MLHAGPASPQASSKIHPWPQHSSQRSLIINCLLLYFCCWLETNPVHSNHIWPRSARVCLCLPVLPGWHLCVSHFLSLSPHPLPISVLQLLLWNSLCLSWTVSTSVSHYCSSSLSSLSHPLFLLLFCFPPPFQPAPSLKEKSKHTQVIAIDLTTWSSRSHTHYLACLSVFWA